MKALKSAGRASRFVPLIDFVLVVVSDLQDNIQKYMISISLKGLLTKKKVLINTFAITFTTMI